MNNWTLIYSINCIMLLLDEEEDDAQLLESISSSKSSSLFRKRWDDEYLVALAQREQLFHREYRMDPSSFTALVDMLSDTLTVNDTMASLSCTWSGSGSINFASWVGAALIMLGGGRYVEAVRTHGISKPQSYTNLHRVIMAINSCPALDIKYNTDAANLRSIAEGFEELSTHKLFSYCLAIKI